MTGIVFYRTDQRTRVVEFYRSRLGFEGWFKQDAGCRILRRDNLRLGFRSAQGPDTDGIVTVVVGDRDAVDKLYDDLEDVSRDPPEENDEFRIYQFFADDPDGRTVEIQTFFIPRRRAFDPGFPGGDPVWGRSHTSPSVWVRQRHNPSLPHESHER